MGDFGEVLLEAPLCMGIAGFLRELFALQGAGAGHLSRRAKRMLAPQGKIGQKTMEGGGFAGSWGRIHLESILPASGEGRFIRIKRSKRFFAPFFFPKENAVFFRGTRRLAE